MSRALPLLAIALALGCGGTPRTVAPDRPVAPPPRAESLYQRLGGIDAIRVLVDDFVANVAADQRINRAFARTDVARFKIHLVNQLCQITGGPCEYKGRAMRTAHARLGVTRADFDAMLDNLGKSLDKFQVPPAEQRELVDALTGLRADIVGPPPTPRRARK